MMKKEMSERKSEMNEAENLRGNREKKENQEEKEYFRICDSE